MTKTDVCFSWDSNENKIQCSHSSGDTVWSETAFSLWSLNVTCEQQQASFSWSFHNAVCPALPFLLEGHWSIRLAWSPLPLSACSSRLRRRPQVRNRLC